LTAHDNLSGAYYLYPFSTILELHYRPVTMFTRPFGCCL